MDCPHDMPWGNCCQVPLEQAALDGVKSLLLLVGEDPTREGLLKTPARVVKAFREMTEGYSQDPVEILGTVFDAENYDQMIVLNGIRFTSICEHHLLPFIGTAMVGYIPDQVIVGLSKLSRLVEVFARRLQVQERLTSQIADSFNEVVHPIGVGVVVKAQHQCMACRGVRKSDSVMVTSKLIGRMRDPEVRQEFLQFWD